MFLDWLKSFIEVCDSKGITPNESHIKAYLKQVNKLHYFSYFVKFCFYAWDERHSENLELIFLECQG